MRYTENRRLTKRKILAQEVDVLAWSVVDEVGGCVADDPVEEPLHSWLTPMQTRGAKGCGAVRLSAIAVVNSP